MSKSSSAPTVRYFPTTQWTQVLSVIQNGDGPASAAALTDFCQRYRPAVYHFFRRHGCDHECADDYTQEFFASRILKQWDCREGFLHKAQRSGQRQFRSFLCHVLWRFLQDEWKSQHARRSGRTRIHLPLEGLDLSDDEPQTFQKFGCAFDRVFALEIIQKAADRSQHSKQLQAHLRGEVLQAEAARELGLSEEAFKQSFRRFRKRLAADLWDEVSQLVGPDEAEIRAEIRYLMSLFDEGAA